MTFREDMKQLSGEIIEGLGETATLSTAFGLFEILVIFDNAPQDVSLNFDQVTTYGPMAEAKTADVELARAAVGDTLAIDGTKYKINVIRHDGLGITTFALSKD